MYPLLVFRPYQVKSETDFVARNEKFQDFVEKIAKTAMAFCKKSEPATNSLDIDALLGEDVEGESGTKVQDLVADAVSQIREKISLGKGYFVRPRKSLTISGYKPLTPTISDNIMCQIPSRESASIDGQNR